MLTEIDAWLAKKIFFPPIIKWCQTFDWNQYQFYRRGWVLTMMFYFFSAWQSNIWIITAFTGFGLFVFTASSVVLDDRPMDVGSPVFRLLFVALGIICVFELFSGSDDFNMFHVGLTLAIFSEYARAITTIPPKEKEDRRVAYASLRH